MRRAASLVLAALAGLAGPAAAQEQCRLALLLGLDVSASVDETEYRLQMDGLAAALINPSVIEAALSGNGAVAISIYEWSGRFQQDLLIDWTFVRSEADLVGIAERVIGATRSHEDFPTAIGYALGYAATHLQRGPDCLFRTVDISGDGQNNDGFPPLAAYEHFPFDGVTVNGLAIGGASRGIEDYYLAEVIHGPGAFVEYAADHEDFEETMRRKLERELRVMILGAAGD
ncbi:DUF1194 domain-containing protein [Roseibacterium sp. SDUM158017]|uniref:DUF1194 domain-containing protein n=1 Tax=Roseicyclus salinarum TaxID=3036773 RepID=UPI0024156F50|nr:DUF1194 domain-containing protein [Roseibacterium sp. SDUM158017]MDG4649152.1 DUF1194 domain-containing protein [Roseibacterium sp. SDUM158017]